MEEIHIYHSARKIILDIKNLIFAILGLLIIGIGCFFILTDYQLEFSELQIDGFGLIDMGIPMVGLYILCIVVLGLCYLTGAYNIVITEDYIKQNTFFSGDLVLHFSDIDHFNLSHHRSTTYLDPCFKNQEKEKFILFHEKSIVASYLSISSKELCEILNIKGAKERNERLRQTVCTE